MTAEWGDGDLDLEDQAPGRVLVHKFILRYFAQAD